MTILILFLFVATNCVFAENILFYWGLSGISHRISVWPLVDKLVEKGHNVTFFSCFPPKKHNPLVTEITPEHLMKDLGFDMDLLNIRATEGSKGTDRLWQNYIKFAITHCNSVFSNPELVDWINNASYDLVIINAFFNDCAYGLVFKFKAPYIIYGTTSAFGLWSESYGFPDENFPEFTLHYPLEMTFIQRVINALKPLSWHWNRNYYMFPQIEEILKNGLQLKDMPSLSEIEQNVSLVLMNIHHSQEFARSLPALFVEVGGMHCSDEIKPLPKDINDFVESGDEGFIYLSFGTFTKLSSLPKNTIDAIFGAMKRFKTKFLVRWEGDPYQGLPENVKTVQWVEQQTVLTHPKIKAFISHGGLMGTQEATYHAVPMIVVPIFADQDYNALIVSSKKRGLLLELSELTQKKLEEAIEEILGNKIYMENCKKVSKQFKDRPTKPVDTALWWVEYVLRFKDTSHLRPIGINKNWYQRRMLDIWAFIIVSIVGFFILIGLTAYCLVKSILNSNQNSIRFIKKHN